MNLVSQFPMTVYVAEGPLQFESEAALARRVVEIYNSLVEGSRSNQTVRILLGRMLNQVRDVYPAGTWQTFLRRNGINMHTARRAMALANGTPYKRTKPNTDATTRAASTHSLSEVVSESARVPDCYLCGVSIESGVVCESCEEEHETDDVSEVPSVDLHDFGSEPQPVYTTEARSAYLRASFTSEPVASGLVDSERRPVVNHAAADGSKAGAVRPTQLTLDSIWADIEIQIANKLAAAKAASLQLSESGNAHISAIFKRFSEELERGLVEARDM